MRLSRRGLLAAGALAPIGFSAVAWAAESDLSALQPITGDAAPIGRDERVARLARIHHHNHHHHRHHHHHHQYQYHSH